MVNFIQLIHSTMSSFKKIIKDVYSITLNENNIVFGKGEMAFVMEVCDILRIYTQYIRVFCCCIGVDKNNSSELSLKNS